MKPLLSVIVPSTLEKEGDSLRAALALLQNDDAIEVLCIGADESPTRAGRLHLGFERARGEMILFHHPRSRLTSEGIRYLKDHAQEKIWGGFTHRFDRDHWILRFTSWYSNQVRRRWAGVIYLDHCIFFHRSIYSESLPSVSVFEDTLLCYILRKHSQPVILPFESLTSAIRFEKNGFYRQAFINQLMKLAFYLGVPYDTMNKFYEKGLNLNSEYKK